MIVGFEFPPLVDGYNEKFDLIIHIVLNLNGDFSLCNIRTKSHWMHKLRAKQMGSFCPFYFIFLRCLWPEFNRLQLLCRTRETLLREDSEIVVSFSTLSCPLFVIVFRSKVLYVTCSLFATVTVQMSICLSLLYSVLCL